jgi:capsular exopolysaccharide synthesis family protein
VVLVTSTVRGEGKTTIAVSLALAIGQLGKVLLIDADLRGRPAAGRLGLPAGTPGLSDLAAGTAEEAACIHRVDEMGIDMLPAGPPPADPLELLSSRRFAQSLERLRERYDHIVIDSAAAQAVSDPLMLSRVCDAVVLVVRAGKAQLPEIQTTVRRLDRAGAPIIGAVLNACDDDRRRSY